MAKSKNAKKVLDSYTVKGTHKIVKAGDCVLMRAQDSDKPPYVAKIEKIESDSRSNVKVRVRWYYRPEESMGGRRQFHGAKELFLSDHFDIQSADTIEGKCTVHTFKNYTKLDSVGTDDYFCRFEYKASTGGFTPDRVAVYCTCEMPYNPDDLMVQCEACKDWFHSSCVHLSTEQVICLDKYFCADCSPDNHKRGNASFKATHPDTKVCFQREFANSYTFLFCRFHPTCMNISAEQVKKMEQFVCPECSSQPGEKKSRNSHKASPQQEPKSEPKRRKR